MRKSPAALQVDSVWSQHIWWMSKKLAAEHVLVGSTYSTRNNCVTERGKKVKIRRLEVQSERRRDKNTEKDISRESGREEREREEEREEESTNL